MNSWKEKMSPLLRRTLIGIGMIWAIGLVGVLVDGVPTTPEQSAVGEASAEFERSVARTTELERRAAARNACIDLVRRNDVGSSETAGEPAWQSETVARVVVEWQWSDGTYGETVCTYDAVASRVSAPSMGFLKL